MRVPSSNFSAVRWCVALGALAGAGVVGAVSCALDEGGLSGSGTPDAAGDVPSNDATLDSSDGATVDVVIADAQPDADAGPSDGPLSPIEIPNKLQLWLRSDQVVLDDGGTRVLSWPDKSGVGDSNRNAQGNPSNPPVLLPDAGYGQPVVQFVGDTWMQTATWTNAPFSQPLTIFVVGEGNHYFVGSLDANFPVAILAILGELQTYAGSYVRDGGIPTGKRSIVALFNGASSTLYNNTMTPASVGNAGPNGLSGITLGNYAGKQPQFTLDGSLAEIAMWSRALTNDEISSLNKYAAGRYGLVISP